MIDTQQTWQQLKTLLMDLPDEALNLLRAIEIDELPFHSNAFLSDDGNSIEDIGAPTDINPQSWGELLNLLNDLSDIGLAQARTIHIEGEVYNSEATLVGDDHPHTLKDVGSRPT